MSAPYQPRVPRQFVGGYRPRIDAAEKTHGRAPYADNEILERTYPGLLHERVLHCPHPRARIKHLGTAKAAALRGVKTILTYRDPEVARLKLTNAGWTDAVDTVSYEKMMWSKFRDRRVLGEYATWAGDEVGSRSRRTLSRSPNRRCAGSRSHGSNCPSCSTHSRPCAPGEIVSVCTKAKALLKRIQRRSSLVGKTEFSAAP